MVRNQGSRIEAGVKKDGRNPYGAFLKARGCFAETIRNRLIA